MITAKYVKTCKDFVDECELRLDWMDMVIHNPDASVMDKMRAAASMTLLEQIINVELSFTD